VRYIVLVAGDIGEPPNVTLPTTALHPTLTWPAHGFTEVQAQTICQAPIVTSDAYGLCTNFTEDSLDFITKSCMLDLQVCRPRLRISPISYSTMKINRLKYLELIGKNGVHKRLESSVQNEFTSSIGSKDNTCNQAYCV